MKYLSFKFSCSWSLFLGVEIGVRVGVGVGVGLNSWIFSNKLIFNYNEL